MTAACKQNREIKVYRVAKESSPAASQNTAAEPPGGNPAVMPGGVMPPGASGDPHAGLSADQLSMAGPGAGPQISDAPPSHWKKQAATSLRQASYRVEGEGGAVTDISLVILRGAAGGTLDNVNRWRGQLGLQAIDEAALKQSSENLTIPAGEAVVVEIEGLAPGADALKDGRMVGVIANHDADAWFFKMRGNSAVTAAEKSHFMQWIRSVKPEAPAPQRTAPSAAGGDGSLAWQVPAGWELQPSASSMRYATFGISGADGAKGELAVTHFPGNVGGDLENVNRWRTQVSLPPVDHAGMAALVSTVQAGPKTISVIDVTGAQSRLAAGWTKHGADTWFFKLTGPDALVGAEKAKFTAFLESVRFTKPE